MVGAGGDGVLGRHSPPWRRRCGAPTIPLSSLSLSSPGENLALSDKAGDGGVFVVPSLGASSWSLGTTACLCVAKLVCPTGGVVDVEAVASRLFLHVGTAAPNSCSVAIL
jgi:hypothetical protein